MNLIQLIPEKSSVDICLVSSLVSNEYLTRLADGYLFYFIEAF